jgi:hypothetical protein
MSISFGDAYALENTTHPVGCGVPSPGRLSARMRGTVSIGDFSRMTHLSVKTLRHYHDVGPLAPAETDKMTGYRYYAKSQVLVAQMIRRFRALDMPSMRFARSLRRPIQKRAAS